MKNVAILLSGRGSNFMALAGAVEEGKIPARIVLVFSDQPEAPGLAEARRRSYPAVAIPVGGRKREAYDQLILEELLKARAEIICLAGFMHILSPPLVRRFPNRILNIHPSLLPSFTGLHAQGQAVKWGVKVSGCTVHFVDEQLDHGPILLQRAVPVRDDDTEETLAARILEEEHRLYPEALRLVCEDRLRIEGRRVRTTKD